LLNTTKQEKTTQELSRTPEKQDNKYRIIDGIARKKIGIPKNRRRNMDPTRPELPQLYT
jgi:hypothetical protein